MLGWTDLPRDAKFENVIQTNRLSVYHTRWRSLNWPSRVTAKHKMNQLDVMTKRKHDHSG